jgi:DNA-binding CsgD family transcriptional regulator
MGEEIANRPLDDIPVTALSRTIASKSTFALTANEHCLFDVPYEFGDDLFWFECFMTVINGKRNSSPHVFVMISDITRRKEMDIQILKAKRELESTIDSLPIAMAVCGGDFRIRRVNKALAGLLGVPPREIIGNICYEMLHKARHPFDFCPLIRGGEVKYPYIFMEKGWTGNCFSSVSPMDGEYTCCSYIIYNLAADDAVRKNHFLQVQKTRMARSGHQKEEFPPSIPLSRREKEVLKMIVSGKSNKDISERLFISVKTVETHRARIMKKLGVHKSTSMIVKALEYNLV